MKRTFLVAVVASIAGFVVGRASAPAPPPRPPAPAAIRANQLPAAQPPRDLPACRQQLALATGLLQAVQEEKVGRPVPFPDGIDPRFGPDGFESAVREAIAACPDVDVRLAHVDCDEYPCLAFFSQPTGGMNHSVDALRACPEWQERFPDENGQANSRFMTDAGIREYSVLAPAAPSGPASDDNSTKRWEARLAAGAEELMAEWGGRELTPLEQVDASIAFFEQNGADDDATEQMLAMLRQKRSQILAEPANR